jgi:hypothetical protein
MAKEAGARRGLAHLKKYLAEFEKHFAGLDSLDLIVLKGQLLIETALDNILSTIFFHPEHIFRGRFGFAQKVQIARAYCLDKDKLPIWPIILSVNAVRNEIAHNLEGKRQQKLDQLRRLLVADNEDITDSLNAIDDTDIVRLACYNAVGFLGTYEDDLKALRQLIDGFRVAVRDA